MLKLKKANEVDVKQLDIKDLIPDISKEIEEKIQKNLVLKKEIIDYVTEDHVGSQFHAVRLCSIPDDPRPLEEEVESLEYEFDNMDDDDERRPKLKRKLYSKKKQLEKLKKPYRYFDDICESYLTCPLYKGGIAPIGERCYLEMQYVSQKTEGYINEFGIDLETDHISREQIAQMVLCDLMVSRAYRAISVTGMTSIGEKIGELGVEYTRQRNHLFQVVSDMQKMKNKLLETMLGTPEIRKKYKIDANKSQRQVEAEKATAALIEQKESVKKNKMPNLLQANLREDNDKTFKIEEVELVD